MSVQELSAAVSRLAADELDAFARWFEEYRADAWDRRIEADAAAGRLDAAGRRADKNFGLLRNDPRHPSLRFKKAGEFWSARVGLAHRALARERPEGYVWFWIGDHDDYDRLLRA